MLDRDYRDIFAGLALTVAGAAAALYALSQYSIGTITRMGPGMMPVALGVILAVFGLAIAIPAIFRQGDAADLRVRPFVVLSICILSFAVLIETTGLIPAVFATAVIATFAENKVRLIKAAILGAAMSVLTWAIFILGLGLPIPAFDWPF